MARASACAWRAAVTGSGPSSSVDLAHRGGGLVVLRLAVAQRVALGLQLRTPLSAAGVRLGLVAWASGRPGGVGACAGPVRARLRHVALLGQPDDALQAQAADGGDLLGRRDAEARQRERMRHPAQLEADEHADLQVLDGDGAGHERYFWARCDGDAALFRGCAGLSAPRHRAT
jgi:hypothetical protein